MHIRICLSNPTTYILDSTNPPFQLLCSAEYVFSKLSFYSSKTKG